MLVLLCLVMIMCATFLSPFIVSARPDGGKKYYFLPRADPVRHSKWSLGFNVLLQFPDPIILTLTGIYGHPNGSLTRLTIDGTISLARPLCGGATCVGFHVCQKWTGRPSEVPLMKGGRQLIVLEREKGGRGFMLEAILADCVFFFFFFFSLPPFLFSHLTPLFLCLSCFHCCFCLLLCVLYYHSDFYSHFNCPP